MEMRNAEIALHFDELAELAELDGKSRYKVIAYRNAAKTIREATVSVAELSRQGRARELPGVGEAIDRKLADLLETGSIPTADTLRARYKPRLLLPRALELSEELAAALREHPAAERVEIAGSVRRWAETSGDADLVAIASDPGALVEAFCALSLIAEVTASSQAGAKVVTHYGVGADLRIVAPESFGNLFQQLTGSKAHNEALREDAAGRGLRVREDGIAAGGGEVRACATEEEVYETLGLPWIPPELREDRGELEAAREGGLPELVRAEDVRGDLHCHTVASDGRNTIEEMAEAARARGYEYLAITDHSASHGFGDDVSPGELRRQIERVRELDASLGDGFKLLAGSEVNVLPDGSLDYDDELLAELDWVVASVHTSFRMGEREMTERVVRAIEHPLVDALAHPTGRLIGRREPYALDLERVVEVAVRTGTFLEVNANPDRRDLSEQAARAAAEAGATLVVCSDAHGAETLTNLRYGLATARRAWLTAANLANTRSWAELDQIRKRRT